MERGYQYRKNANLDIAACATGVSACCRWICGFCFEKRRIGRSHRQGIDTHSVMALNEKECPFYVATERKRARGKYWLAYPL